MGEFERILWERKEEDLDRQNAKIISKILQGKRTPATEKIIEALKDEYSKYGKLL